MTQTIMVVDDSLTVRMDLRDAFCGAGFDTVLCASAAEARGALETRVPDLVVLDIILPDADGIELLDELRQNPATASLPVILLSSEAAVEDRVRGLVQGASEYVGKPYDEAHVMRCAHKLLDTKAGRTTERLTVLIIDDSLTYREALSESLESAGYRTHQASTGEAGLERAEQLHPDAIIVDGVMPGMEGTAVIRGIRLTPGLQSTPCLLLTAAEGTSGEIAALDAGADAYVRKGEGTEMIVARLRAMVRTAQDSRERAYPAASRASGRVLAVDDSRTYLEALAERLREDGYEVVKATSGEEALELLTVDRVDCILLDLLMPGMSGTETCRTIKNSSALRNVPLIMLTALEDPRAVIDGMNAGADDYVVKSVDFEVIRARVRAQLRRKQFEDENRMVREQILRKDAEARAARERAEAHEALLKELGRKNEALESLNEELRMFAYSVSHDLRQPLRSMDGFSRAVLEGYGAALDEKGRHYLERVRAGAQRMNDLIEGLLGLSRVTRRALSLGPLRLDVLARRVATRLEESDPSRDVEIRIDEPIHAHGDGQLVESVLENLIGNAWKFTAREDRARIEVGCDASGDHPFYFVRDNGVGFKMKRAGKLFTPFQRLHSDQAFPGTGIGLATTQRIVHRHGGRIWAQSEPGNGATFCFTLGTGAPE